MDAKPACHEIRYPHLVPCGSTNVPERNGFTLFGSNRRTNRSFPSIPNQPHRRRPKHSSRASLGSHFGHDQPDPCRFMARSYYPSAGSYTGGFPSKKDILNAAAGCWGDRVHIILGRSWKLVYTIHPIFPLNVVARMVMIFPLFTYGAKFKQIEMPTGRSTTRRKRHPKCTF